MRPYTGWDGDARGVQPGLKALVDVIVFLNQGKIRNLGTWQKRYAKGKPGQPSVHGTGRAADLGFETRTDGERIIKWLIDNADDFGLELLIDYYPKPHGRAWRCDRQRFKTYDRKTVHGAPGGRWIHIELSPTTALDRAAMDAAITKALGA